MYCGGVILMVHVCYLLHLAIKKKINIFRCLTTSLHAHLKMTARRAIALVLRRPNLHRQTRGRRRLKKRGSIRRENRQRITRITRTVMCRRKKTDLALRTDSTVTCHLEKQNIQMEIQTVSKNVIT